MISGGTQQPFKHVMDRLEQVSEQRHVVPMDPSILPTGFPSIDRALDGGLSRGDLHVLAGDNGSGASALALAIALRCEARSLLLTSEMQPERAYERALAMTARVSLDAIRMGTVNDEQRTRLATAVLELRDRTPLIALLDAHGVAGVAHAIGSAANLEFVIVDGLEALLGDQTSSVHSRQDTMALALLALKRLALSHNVAVLVLAHLPNLDPQRSDCRPRLSDFGAEGAVGVHADVVLGLYREELYSANPGHAGETELLILKNRDGQAGYVDLFFQVDWIRFEEVFDELGPLTLP